MFEMRRALGQDPPAQATSKTPALTTSVGGRGEVRIAGVRWGTRCARLWGLVGLLVRPSVERVHPGPPLFF